MNPLFEKISSLIPSQLPEFVRDDTSYENFVSFVQAYYEWLEQTKQITYESKHLLSYFDVDETLDEFVQYFIDEFLPYFPEDSLADKRKVLKIARELYTTKGTPGSYKLLFRLLYNSDVDILITGDLVLRASMGNWFAPKFLKVTSDNSIFRNESILRGYKIFGETSKSIATIEISKRDGTKFNVYISDIGRQFQPGENIFVIDTNNQFLYSLDGELVDSSIVGSQKITGSILGEIISISIDQKNQGSNYKVGDPVVFYGGLVSVESQHATAFISETTSGSINRVGVINGGYGYIQGNTEFTLISAPPVANADIEVNNYAPAPNSEISYVVFDKISSSNTINDRVNITLDSADFLFDYPNANANTSLIDALTFSTYYGLPIAAIVVNSGGVGYPSTPTIIADSVYPCNFEDFHKLRRLGILAPVLIRSGGSGYEINDTIKFTGGSGYGAFANVTNVSSNGAITEVSYVYDTTGDVIMPLGGLGYKDESLPILSVESANVQASGASLYVPCVLGSGSSFSVVTDSIGLVKRITVTSGGTDYSSAPSVSLRIQDLVISNTNLSSIPRDSRLYQLEDPEDLNSINYIGFVSNQNIIFNDTVNNLNDVYVLRTYNYNRSPSINSVIYVDSGEGINNTNPTFSITSAYDNLGYTNGIKTYGDGNARATANYVQILNSKEGYYISTDHQPSSYSLLQSEKYNDFSYEIAVSQPIFKYRDAVKGLLHPSGLRLFGKDLLGSNGTFNMHSNSAHLFANSLQLLANSPDAYVELSADLGSNTYTKTIQFYNINIPVSELFSNGQYIEIVSTNGYDSNAAPYTIYSDIQTVDDVNDTVEMVSGAFLKFANVAFGYADGNDYIYISNNSISNTPGYNIINNGNYSNSNNHLVDIVFANDSISLGNNTYTVLNVNSNIIYVNTSTVVTGNSSYPVPFTINRTIVSNTVFIHLPY